MGVMSVDIMSVTALSTHNCLVFIVGRKQNCMLQCYLSAREIILKLKKVEGMALDLLSLRVLFILICPHTSFKYLQTSLLTL